MEVVGKGVCVYMSVSVAIDTIDKIDGLDPVSIPQSKYLTYWFWDRAETVTVEKWKVCYHIVSKCCSLYLERLLEHQF